MGEAARPVVRGELSFPSGWALLELPVASRISLRVISAISGSLDPLDVAIDAGARLARQNAATKSRKNFTLITSLARVLICTSARAISSRDVNLAQQYAMYFSICPYEK